MTGSISAYKACEVISYLCKQGHEVQCVASQSALKFIGTSTLEGLTGKPVFTDAYENGRQMEHIHLNRWADLVILCPATASTLNKLASGFGDDVISMLFLAHDFTKPYLVAPAMNHSMYHHPSTQASLSKLKNWGIEILSPEKGILACGENGDGRLMSPKKIIQSIESHLSKGTVEDKSSRRKAKILITSGGTEENIDPVRTLSNFSTGQTGAFLSDHFFQKGYEVTLLSGHRSKKPQHIQNQNFFRSFKDLDQKLREELSSQSYDFVIHLSAVSDFSISHLLVNDQRIDDPQEKISSRDSVSIVLKPNFKIIERLKEYSKNKNLKVIGFKLTRSEDHEKRMAQVERLLSCEGVDYVVHNELSQISVEQHPFSVYDRSQKLDSGENKPQLAQALESILESNLGE